MAVVKETIKDALLALYNDAKSSKMTEDAFADEMADIIKAAITSGTVTGTAGGDPIVGGAIS